MGDGCVISFPGSIAVTAMVVITDDVTIFLLIKRPLRLLLDGFGSYREPVEADFSDVEFFALVGPTGAGKSTVIDGLCFALYGTVPRWGKENVIAQALAPAANLCRVCLIFESAGKRYGVVRELLRSSRGVVHTKAARLELLDRSIPADAPLADMLAAASKPWPRVQS